MKRIVVGVLTFVIMLQLVACGTTSAADLQIDIDSFAADMAEDISFDTSISKVSESELESIVNLEEGVSAVMYCGDDADMIAVFSCADLDILDAQKDNVKYALKSLKATFDQEGNSFAKKKIDKAVVLVRGYYIIVCASSEPGDANLYIENKINLIQLGDLNESK